MESLPLQNLFQSKMKPTIDSYEHENTSTFGRHENVIAPAPDKLSYFTDRVQAISSTSCKNNKECLTAATKPLLIAFQLLSLFPVTFRKKYCRFTHCWFSFPAVVNILVTWVMLGASITIFTLAQGILHKFRGTDFYTMSLVIICQFASSVVAFGVGNILASTFCKGWQALHDVADDLDITNYRAVKYYILFIPASLMLEGIINTLSTWSNMGREDVRNLVSPYTTFIGTIIANFIPNFLTFSFAVILWICSYLFECLNQSISACLEQPGRDFLSVTSIGIYPQDHASKLAKLRRIHEDLCEAVRLIEKAFGFQLLVIFPATGFRFVSGVYTILVYLMGMAPPDTRDFVSSHGIASILAAFRIMLVILSADVVMTKATGALRALKLARCPTTSDELNQEIDVFLSKIGTFPLEIKCCSIITLNLSFLSTALPTVVTYVLVLMQFKQGDQTATSNCSLENSTSSALSSI